jgi:hypothetical protein
VTPWKAEMKISQELWKRMKAAGGMLKRGEAERLK